jgi:hypothetical protein
MGDVIKSDEDKSIISNIVLKGDLSGLKPEEKVRYYNIFCESLGLNPVTKPFDIITLNNKQVLYAKKECTEQLRKINGVSIVELKKMFDNGLYIVEAKAQDKTGKIDISTGAVSIINLKGDNLANAIMKAETKAKRRVTLSICGLGILDETELETIPEFKDVSNNVDIISEISNTNKIKDIFTTPKKDEIVNARREIMLAISKDEFMNGFKKEYDVYLALGKQKEELTEEEYQLQLEAIKQLKKGIDAYRKNKTGAVNDGDPVDVEFHIEDKKEDVLPKGVL